MELSNWPLNVQFSLACPKPSVDDCQKQLQQENAWNRLSLVQHDTDLF